MNICAIILIDAFKRNFRLPDVPNFMLTSPSFEIVIMITIIMIDYDTLSDKKVLIGARTACTTGNSNWIQKKPRLRR